MWTALDQIQVKENRHAAHHRFILMRQTNTKAGVTSVSRFIINYF